MFPGWWRPFKPIFPHPPFINDDIVTWHAADRFTFVYFTVTKNQMPEEPVRQLNDPDFEAEMLRLSGEAAQASARATARKTSNSDLSLPSQIEARFERLEAELTRSAKQLEALGESMLRSETLAAGISTKLAALDEMRDALQRQQTVDSANQKLFDALHTELKSYKDSFLLDALLKPLIKDLVSLHDDLRTICDQVEALQNNGNGASAEEVSQLANNLDHLLVYLIEILERREVECLPPSRGVADKLQHKIMGSEHIENPEMHGQILRTLRRGFLWRAKSLRPEQVVVGKSPNE